MYSLATIPRTNTRAMQRRQAITVAVFFDIHSLIESLSPFYDAISGPTWPVEWHRSLEGLQAPMSCTGTLPDQKNPPRPEGGALSDQLLTGTDQFRFGHGSVVGGRAQRREPISVRESSGCTHFCVHDSHRCPLTIRVTGGVSLGPLARSGTQVSLRFVLCSSTDGRVC